MPSAERFSVSSREVLAGSQIQASQNMFNAKYQEPGTGARGHSGREPLPSEGAASIRSASQYRKPKWVANSELERFNKFEDQSLSQEHARNARVRIEDPFARRPESNTVFDHIEEAEISKYIASQAYLEKSGLN